MQISFDLYQISDLKMHLKFPLGVRIVALLVAVFILNDTFVAKAIEHGGNVNTASQKLLFAPMHPLYSHPDVTSEPVDTVLVRLKPSAKPSPDLASQITNICQVITFMLPSAYLCACNNTHTVHMLQEHEAVQEVKSFPADKKSSILLQEVNEQLEQASEPNPSADLLLHDLEETEDAIEPNASLKLDVVHSGKTETVEATCASLDGCIRVLYSNAGSRKSRIEVSRNSSLVYVSDRLARLGAVRWIAPVEFKTIDNKFATRIVQSGASSGSDSSVAPFWSIGLNGSDEIVGSGDTGLDVDQCYFADPGKVEKFRALEDSTDGNGHGTHVMGTLAGFSEQGENDGIAKGASISFIDLQPPQFTDSVRLRPPADLANDFFGVLLSDGAYITSNSWSSSNLEYNSEAAEVDNFLSNECKSCLSVFSAGNIGRFGSIPSPSLAKNVITVGSTLSERSGSAWKRDIQQNGGDLLDMYVQDDPFMDHVAMLLAPFGAAFADDEYELIFINPEPSSCAVPDERLSGGRVALTSRAALSSAGCSVEEFAQEVGIAGGRAAIIALTLQCGVERFGSSNELPDNPASIVPTASISKRDGNVLRNALTQRRGKPMSVRIQRRSVEGEPWNKMIASFSARGPVAGGRLKPDIVAPGDSIISARAQTDCETSSLSGTSSSTPLVGGSAAIVRQYLREERSMNNATGELIKAILINGAVDVNGFVTRRNLETNEIIARYPVENAPSCEQGFGRLELAQSLPITNASDSPESLLLFDDQLMEVPGDVWSRCLQFKPSRQLRVTLSYYDAPSDETSGGTIQSSLMLSATANDGSWQWPRESDSLQFNSNLQRMVLIRPTNTASPVLINVTANRLPVRSQRFALAVSGDGISEISVEECSLNGANRQPPPPPGAAPPSVDPSCASTQHRALAMVAIALALCMPFIAA